MKTFWARWQDACQHNPRCETPLFSFFQHWQKHPGWYSQTLWGEWGKTTVKEEALNSHVHQPSSSALNISTEEFIKNYAEHNAIMLPGRHPGHRGKKNLAFLCWRGKRHHMPSAKGHSTEESTEEDANVISKLDSPSHPLHNAIGLSFTPCPHCTSILLLNTICF